MVAARFLIKASLRVINRPGRMAIFFLDWVRLREPLFPLRWLIRSLAQENFEKTVRIIRWLKRIRSIQKPLKICVDSIADISPAFLDFAIKEHFHEANRAPTDFTQLLAGVMGLIPPAENRAQLPSSLCDQEKIYQTILGWIKQDHFLLDSPYDPKPTVFEDEGNYFGLHTTIDLFDQPKGPNWSSFQLIPQRAYSFTDPLVYGTQEPGTPREVELPPFLVFTVQNANIFARSLVVSKGNNFIYDLGGAS